MVGGVDQPYDNAEKGVALGEELYAEYPSEKPGRDHGSECHVEGKKVEDAIVAHEAKVLLTRRCRKRFVDCLLRFVFDLLFFCGSSP